MHRWAPITARTFAEKLAAFRIRVAGHPNGSAARAGHHCVAPPGSAMHPIGSNKKHLLDTLPRYRAGIERLWRLTREAGRDPASLALTYRVKRYGEGMPDKASDGERRLFSGSMSDITADLKALHHVGVSAVDIDFERPDAEASIAEMRRFHERVISAL